MPNIKLGLTTIFPTELDIAETNGKGKIGDENNMQQRIMYGRPYNHIIPTRSGGIPQGTAGLVVTAGTYPEINVSAGECWINGTWCQFSSALLDDADAKFDVVDDMDNYFFIRLDRDGNNRVQRAIMERVAVAHDAQFTHPNEAVPIACVVTDGVPAIAEIRDMRPAAFSQPTFLEMTAESTGTGVVYSSKSSLYVPWYGEYSSIACIFNVGSTFGIGDATGQLRVTGPLGNVVSPSVTVTGTGTVGSANNAALLTVPFLNKNVGRYNQLDYAGTDTMERGGYVDVEVGVAGSFAGMKAVFESYASKLTGGKDFRATARISEWGSKF